MSDPDPAGSLDLDHILFPVAKKDTKTMELNLVSFLFVEIIAVIPEISPLN
jgi:hypothetical protein